jgi:cytochrome c oxidase subunit 2
LITILIGGNNGPSGPGGMGMVIEDMLLKDLGENMLLRDLGENYQIGFQDAASPIMEGIINFHNYIFVYMAFVIALVIYMLVSIMTKYSKGKRSISHKYLVHGTQIELV